MEAWEIVGLTLFGLYLIYVLLSAAAVFGGSGSAQSAWAWLLALLCFPVFGLLLYLLFGREGRRQAAFRQKGLEDLRLLARTCFEAEPYIPQVPQEGEKLLRQLLRTGSLPLAAKDGQIFSEGAELWEALQTDIKAAKNRIWLESYLLRSDETGRALAALLAEKAAEGVQVRVLYDSLGCRGAGHRLFAPLRAAGGEEAAFLPPLFWRLNFRNHRKVIAIDGIIGYIGGFNIGSEYLGLSRRFGHWRDAHLRFCGSAVYLLEQRFAMDRDHLTGQTTDLPPLPDYGEGVPVQIASGGPDCSRQTVRNALFTLITGAKESIRLASPYFVPDEALLTALETAALSGVTVEIMLPANPDHPFVFGAALSWCRSLLPAGVKVYLYENGFLHSKVLAVDEKLLSLGTTNLDVRSFRLNFETNAFVYDEYLTLQWVQVFEEDKKDCRLLTAESFAQLPLSLRFRIAVGRLLSPLL